MSLYYGVSGESRVVTIESDCGISPTHKMSERMSMDVRYSLSVSSLSGISIFVATSASYNVKFPLLTATHNDDLNSDRHHSPLTDPST